MKIFKLALLAIALASAGLTMAYVEYLEAKVAIQYGSKLAHLQKGS
jgi:hypothetical protein